MLVEEFMNNFVTQFHAVEEALVEARAELNEAELPEGVGPLRLSKVEIANIVLHAGGFTIDEREDKTADEKQNERLIMEGLDELSEQLYLHQYPETVSEVMADFHRDMVTLIRLTPSLMKPLSPIVRQFKVETDSRLSTSRKFEVLLAMVEDVLESLPDDTPNYALRILDEVADFSECMTIVTENVEREAPTAANDNVAAA
ncbi:hypothetical protein OIU34_18915 [Pararhizobium sp. BT-229]|uniref:hypothetical protein n=1 Tax=Pararhizobium sp. BT-229 TaxID=2986923 RepID=UPI0021F6E087|nr:hypothetical protein [Pararhizobium sp. BT-229]MCV9963953.1 hypothetical protein [Pararhizobium sp. BT-229]